MKSCSRIKTRTSQKSRSKARRHVGALAIRVLGKTGARIFSFDGEEIEKEHAAVE